MLTPWKVLRNFAIALLAAWIVYYFAIHLVKAHYEGMF